MMRDRLTGGRPPGRKGIAAVTAAPRTMVPRTKIRARGGSWRIPTARFPRPHPAQQGEGACGSCPSPPPMYTIHVYHARYIMRARPTAHRLLLPGDAVKRLPGDRLPGDGLPGDALLAPRHRGRDEHGQDEEDAGDQLLHLRCLPGSENWN